MKKIIIFSFFILASCGKDFSGIKSVDVASACSAEYKSGLTTLTLKSSSSLNKKISLKFDSSGQFNIYKGLYNECDSLSGSFVRSDEGVVVKLSTFKYNENVSFNIYIQDNCDSAPKLLKEKVRAKITYEPVNPKGACHDYVQNGAAEVIVN